MGSAAAVGTIGGSPAFGIGNGMLPVLAKGGVPLATGTGIFGGLTNGLTNGGGRADGNAPTSEVAPSTMETFSPRA